MVEVIMRVARLADAGGVKGRVCLAALAWWRLSAALQRLVAYPTLLGCARGTWSRRLSALLAVLLCGDLHLLPGRQSSCGPFRS